VLTSPANLQPARDPRRPIRPPNPTRAGGVATSTGWLFRSKPEKVWAS